MALLTLTQLAAIRQDFVATLAVINKTKPQINVALQAIEDWFEANRASLGAAIEAAAPGQFTGAQKLKLVKFWLRSKFERE